jgi:hypothetical protein
MGAMAVLRSGDGKINSTKIDHVINTKNTVIENCTHDKKPSIISRMINRKNKTKNHVKRNYVVLPVILSPTTAFLFSI